MDPLQQLRARPTFEQAEHDYLALLDQIRAAVSAAVPSLIWQSPKAIRFGQAMCAAPYTDIPGTNNADYDGGYTKGNIPDDVWPTLSRTVIDLAAQHGFTHVIPLVDKPGRHTLVIWDDHDAHLELGTLAAATLTLFGGCFLTAAAHPSTAPDTAPGDTTSLGGTTRP
jgi:hypothetical protein